MTKECLGDVEGHGYILCYCPKKFLAISILDGFVGIDECGVGHENVNLPSEASECGVYLFFLAYID